MTRKTLFSFAAFVLAAAGAATHGITIYQPVTIGGADLKPGDYKIEVKENAVMLTRGKQTIEAPVKVETSPTKFNSTTVRYSNNGDGKQTVDEIRIGGTNTVLVFHSTVSQAR